LAGEGKEIVNDTFSSDPNFTYAVTSSFSLEFKQIPGWSLPGSNTVLVAYGSITNITAVYSRIALSAPQRFPGALRITLSGGTGRVYTILASTNLLTPLSNWHQLLSLTNLTGQTNFTDQATNVQRYYYRAKEMP